MKTLEKEGQKAYIEAFWMLKTQTHTQVLTALTETGRSPE